LIARDLPTLSDADTMPNDELGSISIHRVWSSTGAVFGEG
jgi:hypothetical protein